ncbi:acyl carrier protein [Qipengyuania sp.]|uniref:acyl carrier protein n=1 Tax=Qipengyuania sp. TaxID=2004515 RepID=UPI0035C86CDD
MTPHSATTTDATGPSRAEIDSTLRAVLVDVLGLEESEVAEFDADTGLFGHLPELDSMAVATLLTEIEDQLDITIEDDEVEGEMMESYGALLAFVEAKTVEA